MKPPGRDLAGQSTPTGGPRHRLGWGAAAHYVRFRDTEKLHHPVVGDITLTYNHAELAATP